MKLNKTYLPILMALIVSVSSIQTKYSLGRTIGDYSHFAESLFSNKKVEAPNNDEYYMNHHPPATNFINDLDIFSRDGEEGKEFKIKDLMKYVITPENELENLSSKGQLSFEIEHENTINELEKKKRDTIKQKRVSIPGTYESVKSVDSSVSKPVEKVKNNNLRLNSNLKTKNVIDVPSKHVNLNKPSILSLKTDSQVKSILTPAKQQSQTQTKEVAGKKESKEELLNDIFSDMD